MTVGQVASKTLKNLEKINKHIQNDNQYCNQESAFNSLMIKVCFVLGHIFWHSCKCESDKQETTETIKKNPRMNVDLILRGCVDKH